ncbi:MAG TPA: class I SAM-dependent methyltransferase [Burkholderiales bacterium]|nr:class I SAM-dependent methyltransferase [Burkholderiales bacterium]
MKRRLFAQQVVALMTACLCATASAQSAPAAADYKPAIGQDGKDVIWIPTEANMIERMLRMAQVTPRDVVVDLGSGDGRVSIAAAREFGARAHGLEYNPDMVALSRREAQQAGVAERVKFEQADIFESDFSDATVVTMFLLPALTLRLRPTLLKMKPGTRVVSNQFDLGDWAPDETADLGGRLAYLWVVPAQVAGNWKIEVPATRDFELTLQQGFQRVLGWAKVANGRSSLRELQLAGPRLRFALVDDKGLLFEFDGRVEGKHISGEVRIGGGAPAPFSGERSGD